MVATKSKTLKRLKAKKRKGFSGVRRQDIARITTCTNGLNDERLPSSSSTATERKLMNSSFTEIENEQGIITRATARNLALTSSSEKDVATGYVIQDLTILQSQINKFAVCRNCMKPSSSLHLIRQEKRRYGLAEILIVKCTNCFIETDIQTSAKIDEKSGGGAYEVNRRSVVACNTLKGGRQLLANFCGAMNLPAPVNPSAYSKHLKKVTELTLKEAEEKMLAAANRVKSRILEKNPELENYDPDGAVPVAVSVDGTWHKRGFSSKYGIVVAILVDTGEVVDFEILSLHCHECRKHAHDNQCSDKYVKWKEQHLPNCNVNYKGSSGAMEGQGALSIFKRSINSRGLKYTTFIGDGDSDTFKTVSEGISEVYGDRYVVRKEECIGHVQKRMGNALRNMIKNMKGQKLCDGKAVGGRGRLTKEKINQFQSFYGKAIRDNVGNLERMHEAIWAILYHSVKPSSTIPLEDQHKYCPQGKASWCKFQSDKEGNEEKYSEINRLPSPFFELLKPVFERLTHKNLLTKCQLGLTQNANESFNSLVWSKCPKTVFCGKDRISFATAEAVMVFNTGAGGKALILKSCGIRKIGKNSFHSLRKEDANRRISALQKVTKKYKIFRMRRYKEKGREELKSKESYIPGGFNTEGEKETGVKRKRCSSITQRKRESEKSNSIREDTPSEDECNIPITFSTPLEYINCVR